MQPLIQDSFAQYLAQANTNEMSRGATRKPNKVKQLKKQLTQSQLVETIERERAHSQMTARF